MLYSYRCVVEEDGTQFNFDCMAEDEAHAREQAQDAYPQARIDNARLIVHSPAQAMAELRGGLRSLVDNFPGFDTEEDVNGADLVEAIGEIWPLLKHAANLDPSVFIDGMLAESQEALLRVCAASEIVEDKRQEAIGRLTAMKEVGVTFADVVGVFGESRSDSTYIRAAERKSREGELEVDDIAIVSKGDDDGAYVMSWLWVSDEEAEDCTVSASIEHMLTHIKPLAKHDVAEYVAWAEDLVENHGDRLDVIQDEEPIATEATPITWEAEDGKTLSFLPSDALSALLKDARSTKFVYDDGATVVEEFIHRFGSKLDRMLVNIPTASIEAEEHG